MVRAGFIAASLILVGAACGDDAGSDATDDDSTDGDVSDGMTIDASSVDAEIDAPGGLPATCTGSCATTALTATFGGTTRVLNVAYYGLTRAGAETTIRVEAYRGADPGCPTGSSGTPDQTLILVAMPIPTTTDPSSTTGTLLDFEGALLTQSISASTSMVTLTPVAANICASCVGMPAPSDPDGVLAVDADLTYTNPAGTITGHFYATHCDSLDAIE